MKLIRFGEPGKEKPGIRLSSGEYKDCSQFFNDWNHDFFQSGGLNELSDLDMRSLPEAPLNSRIGACIARPWKVLCIGLNYSDHAKESGMDIPKEPVLFTKTSNTVVGPYDDVLIPRNSKKTDWEVELGVVISKNCRYLESEKEAESFIAGYCISHDVSEREFQLEKGGQWIKGKSCDTFNPLGPWLVTPDEIKDPNDLNMALSVNGQQMQKGNTKTMIFNVPHLIYYLSQFLTLEAGDVITTGTPPGVGLGQDPQRFLKEGDVVELSIDHLGTQKQTFKEA
ncbi:MAG: fumarylacetoacetate hydrolase family protein [Verrucomicrobiota bacterium]